MGKSTRKSNFELLRVIAMFWIIAHHLALHTDFAESLSIEANEMFRVFMLIGGKWGVNIFVLISGYFLCTKASKMNKIFKMLTQMWFYTIVVMIILAIRGELTVEYFDIGTMVFPFLRKANWYCVVYICLYFLSDYINLAFTQLSKRKLQGVILMLVILQLQYPDLPFNWINPLTDNVFGDLSWFITMYLIGGYIKVYGNKLFDNIPIFAVISIVCMGMLYFGKYLDVENVEIKRNNLYTFVWSVSAFVVFKNLKIKNSKIINTLATGTFGVYLFHDNDYMREIFWNQIVKADEVFDKGSFIVYCIFYILVIFAIGSVIDFVRRKFIADPFWNIIDNKIVPRFKELKKPSRKGS